MGDNFPNYRHFQTHAGSPFVPPQSKRRSLGTSTGGQRQEIEPERGQERVTQPSPIRPVVNQMTDINWGYTGDPFLDSYSQIVSEGSTPRGIGDSQQFSHNEEQVESPPKRKQNMNDKGKKVQKEGGTPNKRWEDEHTDELLKILASEANEGKKCDKAFRNSSYLLVSNMVNEKFGTSYTINNVINHMRGWKSKWQDIMKAKELSGAGWDDELKMVMLDEETHEDLKKAKAKVAPWINIPIRNYELLRIACGDDHARGDFARDLSTKWGLRDDCIDVDALPSGSQQKVATSQSTKSSGGKRRREPNVDSEAISHMVEHVSKMANALSTGFMTPFERMSAKLFALEGYESRVLKAAYNYLCNDTFEANKFIGLPDTFQKEWLDAFILEKCL